MIQIKKYGNRRLYDTAASRYITLDELEQRVQSGDDVQVVNAKSGEDLTQATLVQIIIEGRGAARMLPVPLLVQLIRLGDEALAEFFGRYVAGALELFLQARSGAQQLASYNPFGGFGMGDAFSRMMGHVPSWPQRPVAPPPPAADDVARLRRDLEELKQQVRKPRRKR